MNKIEERRIREKNFSPEIQKEEEDERDEEEEEEMESAREGERLERYVFEGS